MRRAVFLGLTACGRIHFGSADRDGSPIDDAPTDGAPISDASLDAAAACGTLELSDSFDDGVLDVRWASFSEDGGMVVTETGGVVRVTLSGANIAADRAAGILDSMPRDYSDRCVAVAVERLAMVNGVFSKVTLGQPAEHAGFDFSSNNLNAFARRDGDEVDLGSAPYDPIAHKVVRFRHGASDIVLETSAALAGPFTVFQTTELAAIDITNAQLTMQVQTGAANVDGMNETFDISLVTIHAP